MTDTNGTANGQAGESRIAETLQNEVTVGYRPQLPLESMWLMGGGDMPQITLRRDIEFMQLHPVVSAAMDYYKSGIAGAEFWGGPTPNAPNPSTDKGRPISPDSRVSQFVLAHVERFWQRGVPIMQEGGYPYGWAPGEHIYKESEGMLVWDHMKGFHPSDGFVLTLDHQAIGIRVKGIRDAPNQQQSRGGKVDLWFANEHIPAKGAWYPHRPRFNQYYGRSQLAAAWRPWRRLGWRDGAEQVMDAAVYRGGYCGPVMRYPPGGSAPINRTGVPATQADGQGDLRRDNRDVAIQYCQWAKAGASFAISSENWPQAAGGGPKWELVWPEHVMDVGPLIKDAEYLESQIMLGMGVPPELVKPGGTGSGYSGRSIPREAFLDGQQRVADAMLQGFVEQVLRPLVKWNFGEVPFNVQCKPLLKSQAENKQGGPVPPLPQPPEQPPPPEVPPPGAPSGQAMSLEARASIVAIRARERLRRSSA